MNHSKVRRAITPEVTAALVVIATSVFLLSKAAELPPESSQFPNAVLRIMIVLALVFGSRGLVKNWKSYSAREVFKDRARFFYSVGIIITYAICVDVVGFYSSTIVMLPATAFLFGYRDARTVAITTMSLVAALFVLFTLLLGRTFPTEFFLR